MSKSLAQKALQTVVAATVQFVDEKQQPFGQGVLVPGGLILTAAHVVTVDWSDHPPVAGVFNERECLRRIVTAGDQRFQGYLVAVEPMLDLAVLGAPDGQWLHEDADAFEAFVQTTAPVPLETTALYTEQDYRADIQAFRSRRRGDRLGRSVPAYVHTHTREWVRARVTEIKPGSPTLMLETETLIQGGTSGSPVVTADGRLLGVMSWVGFAGRVNHPEKVRPGRRWEEGGTIPRPHQVAPVYLAKQMLRRSPMSV